MGGRWPYSFCVIYWPSTKPSIKRCNCVNKRKNSGSRWTLDNNINRCTDGSRQSKTGCQRVNQLADWGFATLSDPRLSNPSQDAKEMLLWSREELGSILLSVPVSNSSLTYNKHHPFENKVWEIYLYKEVCSFVRSFVEVVMMFDYVSACIFVLRLYNSFFVGCYFQYLFSRARSILVLLTSNFFSILSVSVYVVHPYCSIDTTAAWKKMRFCPKVNLKCAFVQKWMLKSDWSSNSLTTRQ